MKRINQLTWALSFLGLSSLALAYAGTTQAVTQNVAPNMIPTLTPGFGITLTGLYLQPSASGGNLTYATYTSPTPIDSPSWRQENTDPKYHGAFDLGLQYTMADTTDQVKLDWMYFNSTDLASATSTGTDSVAPPYSFGPGAQFSGGSANTSAHFQINNINLTLDHLINVSSNIQMTVFDGISTAYLKEGLTSSYLGNTHPTGSPNDLTPFDITSYNTSEFTGIGPRLGLDTAYFFTPRWSVVGEMAGSLLIGSIKTTTNFRTLSAGTTLNTTLANQKNTAVVPEFNGKMGVTYALPLNTQGSVLTLQAGYMVVIYLNGITQVNPTQLVPDTEDNGVIAIIADAQTASDLGLNGPYASLTYTF